jgi:hypothetical protein
MLEIMMQQFGAGTASQMSRQLGADEDAVQKAIGMALPAIIGAMARNSATPKGRSSLYGALERDHDGTLLDDLAGFLGSPSAGPGDAILGHVFGGQRSGIESQIGQATGLDPNTVKMLMSILAPMVMAYLGRQRQQQTLDPDQLAGILGTERQRIQQESRPELGGLADLFDANKDGDVKDDAARIGLGILGRLLSGRR